MDEPAEGIVRFTISNPKKRNALDHAILDGIAAAVMAPPLPMSRPVETTCTPAARATAAVSSVEPSSATTTCAPGNARASAASVAPRRSPSLWAATRITVSIGLGSVPRHA